MKQVFLLNKFLTGMLALSTMPLPVYLAFCSNLSSQKNSHEGLISQDVIQTVESTKRLDPDGHLYFMENTEDYYGNEKIINTIKEWERDNTINVSFGCSAFAARDPSETTNFTGRVYDYIHYFPKADGSFGGTGCTNFMIHTPKNADKRIKHESIGTVDALMFNPNENLTYEEVSQGLLDNGKSDLSYLALSPYYTVDGINDAGLTASILMLNHENDIDAKYKTKTSEGTTVTKDGKEEMSAIRAVRYILDNCSTVEEAEKAMKENIYIKRVWATNFHIFVTDASFNSMLFEWFDTDFTDNQQQLACIDTNVVTNFYQAFTDPLDNAPILSNLKHQYTYGYWSGVEGYDRFNTIASILDFYTLAPYKTYPLVNQNHADSILRAVNVADTLFSSLFDSNELTQSLYVNQNLNFKYKYSLKEHKFIA